MKKGKFMSRFWDALGIVSTDIDSIETQDDYLDDTDEYQQDTYEDAYQQEAYEAEQTYQPRQEEPVNTYNRARQARTQKGSNVINMQQSQSAAQPQNIRNMSAVSVLVYRISKFDDSREVIENVKNQRPVIVNMNGLDDDEAQRSLDFIGGAMYALGGKAVKVDSNIFVLAPYNIDISANMAAGTPSSYQAEEDEYFSGI
ncbi:MAG: cell division protein SepF [Clostridia bacterium]|nr:cell division protein SepF [Clostridia bacterium]